MKTFALLLVQAVIDLFDIIQRLFFRGPVLGADGLGAFEGHVLEHVRDAGFAAGIVHGADVHVGVEGDHRRLMAFNDQKMEAVGEGELGDFFLKVFKGLRREQRGK